MTITKNELKILTKEFLTASNRILKANYEIYDSELKKFVAFLDTHEIIADFIRACGNPEYDAKTMVEEAQRNYAILPLGTTEKEEVANTYAVIKYLGDNNYHGSSSFFYAYTSAKKYQDKVNAFGDQFIRILISHIENYLNRLVVENGYDETPNVSVSFENTNLANAQVNVASPNATLTQNTIDTDKLQSLIEALIDNSKELSDEDQETVNDCIETIQTISDEKPKKGIIRTALNTLKGIKGTVEFAAAVAEIIAFVSAIAN